jgi:hypothetical protein
VNPENIYSLDFELDFLRSFLALIDSRFVELEKIVKDRNPDDYILVFDDMEYLRGVGFVVCQRYITSICCWWQIDKVSALSAGPKLANGLTYSSVINVAANYWKHFDEWGENKNEGVRLSARQEIENLGITLSGGHVISKIFEKVGASNFSALLPILKEWRSEVFQTCSQVKKNSGA